MFRPAILAAAVALTTAASPALAAGFDVVDNEADFLGLIANKALRHGLLGITLLVEPDGTITGDALGWTITGTWDWVDGAFCREMDWSGKLIDYNCQLVEVRDNRDVRFTVDRGAGDSATFRIRDR